MSRSGWSDRIALLRNRDQFLRALQRPSHKCDLADELDVSRSTIDRGVRELERAGLVERTNSGFTTTLCGEIALREYDRFRRRLDGLRAASDALEPLPSDADLDGALFDGATFAFPDRHSPYEPVDRLTDVLGRATAIRSFAATIVPRYVELYRQRVVEAGVRAHLVLTDDAVSRLVSDYRAAFADVLDADHATIQRTDAERCFSLTLADTDDGTEVAVMLYDDHGIRAFVRNDTTAAVAWARNHFEALCADADPVR